MQLEEEEEIYENDNNIKYVNEIINKVKIMKRSKYRTTNFSIIEYFVQNNFQPLNQEEIILKLLNDYKSNPDRYVLTKINRNFKSALSFQRSIIFSLSTNKSFIVNRYIGQIELNLKNACDYLSSIYSKYVSNSYDVKTPLKLFNNNKFKKNKKDYTYEQKKEIDNNSNDSFDIDIEDGEKISKSQPLRRKKLNKYNNKYYIKPDQSKLDSEIITLSDSNSIDDEKYNNLNYPKIFSIKLINNDLISSINKDSISNLLDSAFIYMNSLDNEENANFLSKKINEIKISLTNLYEYRISYDNICNIVKIYQEEIFNIWKIMENQLKAIKIEISIKTYCYEIYVKLRDIVFKTGENYNQIMENIKQKLNEIINIEKKCKDEKKNIQEILSFIKSHLPNNVRFNEFCKLLEYKLKINIDNDAQLYNIIDSDEDDAFLIDDNVRIIMKKFQEERRIIFDDIKSIDKLVGNITIY